jgi:2-polyprenyl-3-methyl-5-hydroxy-6-metoxy-1,4-benzoquinol methylase
MKSATPELILQNGVFIDKKTRERFSKFERDYLKVRTKEGRVLTSAQIKLLPATPSKEDAVLWSIRRKTIDRFSKYLYNKGKCTILEIGCGNGYFANLLASEGHSVCGVDVNLAELESAAETFKDSVSWFCLNVLEREVPGGPFDIIVFNASIQYFESLEALVQRCIQMLSPAGEIHILDSPFYKESEKNSARQRTIEHFTKMGLPEMADYYYRHDETILWKFGSKKLYRPRPLLRLFLRSKDSPFPWIMIPKQT